MNNIKATGSVLTTINCTDSDSIISVCYDHF